MLTKMYLTNFLSFAERTEFDFTASKYSILRACNVYEDEFLKGAMLIGPNASGKSNALKGISFVVKMIKGEGMKISGYRCFFSKNPITTVEYEFVFNQKKVVYVIEYNVQTNTISEELKIDGILFLRRNGNTGELRIGQTVTIDEQLDGETLFLRTASFNTGRFPQEPTLRKLMDYIQNSYVVDGYNLGATYGKTITKYAEEFGVDKINKVLEDFKYDFVMEYGSESEGAGLKITIGSDQKAVFLKRRNFPIPNIIVNESQGNQVFADLLPNIIRVIENAGMLIIDEFGNSLHNRLAEKIIRFFMDNAAGSQIFITSHHTNLISNSVLRPDQVNLVTFEAMKGSAVKRISQFKPREAQNLEKMYLSGMFEGLPIYEEI
ncbi:MAG: AAA family ATPase [Lachnospiraceae bacterium]|nr:AAA family ATPase [Candidatus Merdinaster equi]